MKILFLYLAREFMKPLFFSVAAFGGLVLVSEFFRELSFYLEHKTSFVTVFTYLGLNFPWWALQVLPVAVLLAVLFSLGQLARHGEITAMKAAGVNPWRIVMLFLFFGACIGGADLALREKIIPVAIRKAEIIRRMYIRREDKPTQTEYRNLVIAVPHNGRMTVGLLNTGTGSLLKVIIDYYDDAVNLKRQIIAEGGTWQSGFWVLHRGIERTYTASSWQDRPFNRKVLSLPLKPDGFIITRLRPEQMTSGEFREYITRFEMLGIPAEKERIQFHLRFASAFSHMIVMLIGIPFALGLAGKHGKIVGFSAALIISFAYWGVQAVGQSLGENRILSPAVAAWLANGIFLSLGFVLIRTIKK